MPNVAIFIYHLLGRFVVSTFRVRGIIFRVSTIKAAHSASLLYCLSFEMDESVSETEVTVNAYGDRQIPSALVPRSIPEAREFLTSQLALTDRGAWLQLPFDDDGAPLLPVAHELGFRVHSASHGMITLQAWRKRASSADLPGSAPNPTPPVGHHAVGAGALVVNADGRILGIKERFDKSGSWLTPGGHVDESEGFIAAAVREAREEAGVAVRALGIAGIYELHVGGPDATNGYPHPLSAADRGKLAQNRRFGSTHVGIIVLCYAADDRLSPDPEEIGHAAWITPEEFAAGAHEREAALVRALATGGQLAAAAVLARAERSTTSTFTAESAGSLASTGSASPSLIEVARARAAATRGLIGAVEARFRHRRLPNASFVATFYSALPLGGLMGTGLAASPSLLAALPLTASALAATTSGSEFGSTDGESSFTCCRCSCAHRAVNRRELSGAADGCDSPVDSGSASNHSAAALASASASVAGRLHLPAQRSIRQALASLAMSALHAAVAVAGSVLTLAALRRADRHYRWGVFDSSVGATGLGGALANWRI